MMFPDRTNQSYKHTLINLKTHVILENGEVVRIKQTDPTGPPRLPPTVKTTFDWPGGRGGNNSGNGGGGDDHGGFRFDGN